MAKQKTNAADEPQEPSEAHAGFVAGNDSPFGEAGAQAQAARPGRAWIVTLKASTPLPHNPMRIEAASADEAWAKFCAANGIAGAKCERTIERVE